MKELTQEQLKKIIHYDPVTGRFIWLVSSGNAKTGDNCGWNDSGYLRTKINKKPYRLHRLAWLYMTGEWPEQIDHINHNRSDNRWLNLRNVCNQGNQRNRPIQKNNTQGIIGVGKHKHNSKWRAYIYINKNQKSLGYFEDKFEAICARKSAERKYGFHLNHGAM